MDENTQPKVGLDINGNHLEATTIEINAQEHATSKVKKTKKSFKKMVKNF